MHHLKILFIKFINYIQKPRTQVLISQANTNIDRTAKFHAHLHYYSSSIYLFLSLLSLYNKQYSQSIKYCELSIFHDPMHQAAYKIKNLASKHAIITKKQLQQLVYSNISPNRLISEYDHLSLYHQEKKNHSLYHKANSLFHLNNLEKAINSLEIYIQKNHTNHSSFCDLGRILIHKKQYSLSEKHLKKSIKILNNHFTTYTWLGVCQILNNKISNSEKLFKKAIQTLNTHHETYHKNFSIQYYNRGKLYYQNKKFDLSLNDLNRSLDLHRSNINALILRTKIFLSNMQLIEAHLDIEKLEIKAPKNKEVIKIKKLFRQQEKALKNLT